MSITPIVANTVAVAPLLRPEPLRLSQAKPLTNRENRPRVGAALMRAIGIVGLTIKEAAHLLDMDPAQLCR